MGEFSYYFHNVINGEKYWCFERLKALMQSTTLIFNKKHISSTLELFNRNENEDVMKLCSKNISEKTFSKKIFSAFSWLGPWYCRIVQTMQCHLLLFVFRRRKRNIIKSLLFVLRRFPYNFLVQQFCCDNNQGISTKASFSLQIRNHFNFLPAEMKNKIKYIKRKPKTIIKNHCYQDN